MRTKSEFIKIRVTPEFKKAVEKQAARLNHSMSRYITDSINEKMRGDMRDEQSK